MHRLYTPGLKVQRQFPEVIKARRFMIIWHKLGEGEGGGEGRGGREKERVESG